MLISLLTMTVLSISKSGDVPLAAVEGKPTLVYWNSAGWSNPIRLALAAANVPYVDARIEAGDPNSDSYKKAWIDAKQILGSSTFEFPNLPYYMEGETVKLSQSEAIIRHVARQYNLLPKSMPDYRFEMLSEELKDYDGFFISRSYAANGPDVIATFIKEDVPKKLAIWGGIAHNGDALIDGQDAKINILDIKLYCFLRKVKFAQEELNIKPSSHEGWVGAYMKRVEDAPEIKAYVNSDDYLNRPVNNPHASFGNI
jgi:hypothetical protein